MRTAFILGILILVFLLSAGAGGYALYSWKNPAPKWSSQKVSRGDIRKVISSTGSLDAVSQVVVGCQVSGIIASISVDFNSQVTAGQCLAMIDPSALEARVLQTAAALDQAKSHQRDLEAQKAALQSSLVIAETDQASHEAYLRKAGVEYTDSLRKFKRSKALFKNRLISTADFETASNTSDTNKANLDASQFQVEGDQPRRKSILAQIEAIKAQLEGARAQIRQAQAQLDAAQVDLNRAVITSPINGVVISRVVNAGQTVAAGLQTPTLFTIADDLRKMSINISVNEANIASVKEGQTAFFSVKAYPGRTFSGRIYQVRYSAEISQNVVSYPVMVEVDNDELLLFPGMTANVEILLSEKKNVLRLPERALYFQIPSARIPAQFLQLPDPDPSMIRVWKLSDTGAIAPVDIVVGLSDYNYAEIVKGDLEAGQTVIYGSSDKTTKGLMPPPPPPGGGPPPG